MTGVGCAMKIFFFFLFNLVMLGFIYDDLPSFYLSCVMWWDHLFLVCRLLSLERTFFDLFLSRLISLLLGVLVFRGHLTIPFPSFL